MRSIAFALVVLWSAAAGAVPKTVNFTGRLTTSTGPVNGAVSMTLKLYAESSDGTALWSEDHNNVGADNGLVFLDIGSTTTLDDSVLDGRRLFLEITVGGETLAPRLAFNSVPYAVRSDAAATADLLGGKFGPDDVVTAVSNGAGITATRTGNAVTVGLTTTGCSNGQVFKFNGTTFACAADAVGSFTPGNGIAISGSTISLATTNCTSGQVLKFNGTGFSCQADAVGTFTAGSGIAISAGSVISLATTNCSNGQIYKFNSTSGAFACAPDAVGVTAAASPLVLTNSGTTVSLPTTCTANQVLRWNATTMTWACGPAFTAGSCTWAFLRATTSAVTTMTAGCTNKHVISGGCTASAGAVISSAPAGPPGDGDPVGSVTGWSCAFNTPAVNHLAYALCCDTI